jgi:hypothetical protein
MGLLGVELVPRDDLQIVKWSVNIRLGDCNKEWTVPIIFF